MKPTKRSVKSIWVCLWLSMQITYVTAQPDRDLIYEYAPTTSSDVVIRTTVAPFNGTGLFIGETSGWYNPGGRTHTKSFVNSIIAPANGRTQVSLNISFPEFTQFDEFVKAVNDASGNVYAGGKYYFSTSYGTDAVLIKYNSSMVEVWRRYAFSPIATPAYGDATVDVFAVGSSIYWLGDRQQTGPFLIKYTDAGVQQFDVTLTNITPVKVVANTAGDVYVLGYNNSATSGQQVLLRKYNNSGVQVWSKSFNAASGMLTDQPRHLGLDNTGNILFTATGERTPGNYDAYLVKFNSAGVRQWSKYFNGSANTNDVAGRFAVDPADNIYVAHTVRDLNAGVQNNNIFLRKYSPTGSTLATRYYRGSANANDEAIGIFYTGTGRIYMGGISKSTIGRSVVAQYDLSLNLEYTDVITHLQSPDWDATSWGVYGEDFVMDPVNRALYWVGRKEEVYPDYLDYLNVPIIVKYTYPAVPRLAEATGAVSLTVYPNPATDMVWIKSESEMMKLEVYDQTGRLIWQDEDKGQNTQRLDIQLWKNGVYVVRVTDQENKVETSRFVKQ